MPALPESLLPELVAIQKIIELGASHLDVKILCQIAIPSGASFPVYAIALGNPAPDVPAVGFFGGVHGLERIGSQVVIAYLQSLVMRLRWDTSLRRQLESVRLVFMPLVNPGGTALGTRANPHGVDLMRNAPVNALGKVPFWRAASASAPDCRGTGVKPARRLKRKARRCAIWWLPNCWGAGSALRSTAIPVSASVTGSGFPMPIPRSRSGTWPKSMHSRKSICSRTATTAICSSRKAGNT